MSSATIHIQSDIPIYKYAYVSRLHPIIASEHIKSHLQGVQFWHEAPKEVVASLQRGAGPNEVESRRISFFRPLEDLLFSP